MATVIASPAADEFAPFYAGYIARAAAVPSPLDELAAQRERLRRFLSPCSEEQAMFRYAPGKWSVKELVGHLADAERVFAYRLLRIGRGDQTPLPGFEEDDYVRGGAFDRRPLADLLDDWTAVRDATIALANGMPFDAWTRRGTASGSGVSARALLYIVIGHVEHHRGVLEARYGLAGG
jgi:hypothetical protein